MNYVSMVDVVGGYLQLEHAGNIYHTHCPFHKDEKTKSLVIYDTDAYCFGCGLWLNPVSFLMRYLHITKRQALEKLDLVPKVNLKSFKKQPKKDPNVIPIETIKNWYAMLKDHRSYYYSRLFTDETIDREMWGWSGDRYVVPVWGGVPGERCVSVRMRAGKKEMEPKYLGLANYNPRVLYNTWNALNYYRDWLDDMPKTIYIFFGEFDSALAMQDGFPAVSPTNGQNSWLNLWDSFFDGFNVIIVPDKNEEMRGFQVASRFPGRSSIVQWPEGDFNDYGSWRQAGGTPELFMNDIVPICVQPSIEVECFYSLAI